MSLRRIKILVKEIREEFQEDPSYRRGMAVGIVLGGFIVTVIVLAA